VPLVLVQLDRTLVWCPQVQHGGQPHGAVDDRPRMRGGRQSRQYGPDRLPCPWTVPSVLQSAADLRQGRARRRAGTACDSGCGGQEVQSRPVRQRRVRRTDRPVTAGSAGGPPFEVGGIRQWRSELVRLGSAAVLLVCPAPPARPALLTVRAGAAPLPARVAAAAARVAVARAPVWASTVVQLRVAEAAHVWAATLALPTAAAAM
jgi:hypothetical protein